MDIKSKDNYTNFKNLLWQAGFTCLENKYKLEIASYLQVSLRTINRWLQSNRPSKQAIKLLQDRRSNLNSNYWNNFLVKNEKLITPNGYIITANELINYGIIKQRINALENTIL